MGASNSDLVEQNSLYDDWITVRRTEHFSNVVKNDQGLLGEEYVVPFDSKLNLNEQLEIYLYRRNQNIGLVRTYGAEIMNLKTGGFCGGEKTAKVVAEYLPERLSTIPQFSFPQALYTLAETLRGFRQIYRRYGSILINDDMIAFSPEGFAKCWCNPNFALNHPRSDSMVQMNGRTDEGDMVKEILDAVQDRTQNGSFPKNFSDLISCQSYLDFPTAQRLVEDYIEQTRISVPDRINMARSKAINLAPQQKPAVKQPMTTTTTTTTTYKSMPVMQQSQNLIQSQPVNVMHNTMVGTIIPANLPQATVSPQVMYMQPNVPLVASIPVNYYGGVPVARYY